MYLISDFVHTKSLINIMPHISWALGMAGSPTNRVRTKSPKAEAVPRLPFSLD